MPCAPRLGKNEFDGNNIHVPVTESVFKKDFLHYGINFLLRFWLKQVVVCPTTPPILGPGR